MKHSSLEALAFDPIKRLLQFGDQAIALFTKRDLLGQEVSVTDLWELAAAEGILRRQRPNGSWSYSKRNAAARTQEQYDQFETYRQLGILVEQYGFDRLHSAIARAASFLLAFQSEDGDVRGSYGNQIQSELFRGHLRASNQSRVCKGRPREKGPRMVARHSANRCCTKPLRGSGAGDQVFGLFIGISTYSSNLATSSNPSLR